MAQTANVPARNNNARRDAVPIKVLHEQLDKMGSEFAKALPGHITADKFVRTARTAIALTRNIDKVTNAASLLAACTKAAADGLILDGREAALVVDYNGDVQYRPMMRGILKLAWQSNALRGLVVEVVRVGDVFRHSPTNFAQPIYHEINHEKPRGEAHTVYAIAELKDGGLVHEVMSVADVNRIRDRSDAWKAFKAEKIKSTPWHTDWSEMARKTVFRRLSKYLPSSTDREDRLMQAAERIDEDYDFDVTETGESVPVAPKPAAKQRGGAAAALKNVTTLRGEARPDPSSPPEPADYGGDNYDPETGEVYDDSPRDTDDI